MVSPARRPPCAWPSTPAESFTRRPRRLPRAVRGPGSSRSGPRSVRQAGAGVPRTLASTRSRAPRRSSARRSTRRGARSPPPPRAAAAGRARRSVPRASPLSRVARRNCTWPWTGWGTSSSASDARRRARREPSGMDFGIGYFPNLMEPTAASRHRHSESMATNAKRWISGPRHLRLESRFGSTT